LLLFTGLVAYWPSTAHAESWLSWLEELSGPGPFTGYMVSFTVPCKQQDNGLRRWKDCNFGTKEKPQTLVIKFGRYGSDGRPRFKDLEDTPFDDRREVKTAPVSVLWMFHVHRSFQLGPGVGFMRVSGDGFDGFSKLSLTPLSASFTPLALGWNRRWAYVLRLEFDSSYFAQGFDRADFQNTHTKFDSGPEFLTRTGIVFDATALIFRR
jgi:hypothetical protein